MGHRAADEFGRLQASYQTTPTKERHALGARDRSSALLLLVAGDMELVMGRIPACVPDMALVNVLARLELAAKRRGCSIRMLVECADLRALIDLAGLTEFLGVELGGSDVDG